MKKFRIEKDIEKLQTKIDEFKAGKIGISDIRNVEVNLDADEYKVSFTRPPKTIPKTSSKRQE
jgi:hypothetical protein